MTQWLKHTKLQIKLLDDDAINVTILLCSSSSSSKFIKLSNHSIFYKIHNMI